MLPGSMMNAWLTILKDARNGDSSGTLTATLASTTLLAVSAPLTAQVTWLILEYHARNNPMGEQLVNPLPADRMKNMILAYAILHALLAMMVLAQSVGKTALKVPMSVEPSASTNMMGALQLYN